MKLQDNFVVRLHCAGETDNSEAGVITGCYVFNCCFFYNARTKQAHQCRTNRHLLHFFRTYLENGSGFQSLQFRLMEIKLGIKEVMLR